MIRNLFGFFLKVLVLLGTLSLVVVVAVRYDLVPTAPTQHEVPGVNQGSGLPQEVQGIPDRLPVPRGFRF